ncbi:MAG: small ribosomal subunit Rsm22 family protein [Holophagaceae bacterium]
MALRLAPEPARLAQLQARWEAALPALRQPPLPPAWGPALRGLSDRFNRIEGSPRGDYFAGSNLAPYFAHHGWAQAHAIAAVAAETPELFASAREVWDLGAGPGPLSLAASAFLPGARFTLTDLRAEALAFAAQALRTAGVEARTERLRLPDLPEGRPDLVVLGHALNELPPRDQERLLATVKERLAPGGALVVLEPALPEPTRRLMELRAAFREAPWAIAAPCPCPGPCPMLALPRQWCVAELDWDPPSWFKALDAAAGLDRGHLAFSYLVARRDAPAPAPRARVVGVPKPQKGKVERWVCTPAGGERWEALSRHGEPAWARPRGTELDLPPEADGLRDLEGGWRLRRWHP